jgi:acyl-CoA thioester hydrolase
MQPDLAQLRADPRVIWVEDILRYGDTDKIGHINNATFATLCESGRVHLFEERLTATLDPRTFFVIVRLTIDFRAELHFPGRAMTGTWITKLGRSSLSMGQVIASGDTLAAEAESICVLMDGTTRRATPFNDATRAVAGALLRAPAEAGRQAL